MTQGLATMLLDTLELRAGSVITESEIAALKKRWRPRGRLGRKDPGAIDSEQTALLDALPMQVSDEQAHKGLTYLRKLLLTKAGDLRKTKLVKDQNLGSQHAHVIRTLDCFWFLGFYEDCNHFGEVVHLYPVYRAEAHDGTWFDYIARPWVGGEPTFGEIGQELM